MKDIPRCNITKDFNFSKDFKLFNIFNNNRFVQNKGGYYYPVNKWCEYLDTPVDYYYTAWDKDQFNVGNNADELNKITVKTSSHTTVKVTGSTKFNFTTWVNAKLTASIGEKWGKDYTFEITPKNHTSYILDSACKVEKKDWVYFYSGDD